MLFALTLDIEAACLSSMQLLHLLRNPLFVLGICNTRERRLTATEPVASEQFLEHRMLFESPQPLAYHYWVLEEAETISDSIRHSGGMADSCTNSHV